MRWVWEFGLLVLIFGESAAVWCGWLSTAFSEDSMAIVAEAVHATTSVMGLAQPLT